MSSQSLGARSYCKYAIKVTLTFTTLQRNRGSRAQTHKNSMVFVNFCLGQAMTARQPQMLQMSAVETGQTSALATEDMSAVETGLRSAAETGQMSAVKTRQMSAAETGQMSGVETRQVSTSATGRCTV